jgi:DNA-binding transcriptional ArsR family regulator
MKTYWIERSDQIEALSSPTRQDIADRLGAVGPCTVAELAAALGYRPTALYQHLEALKRVGLVESLPKALARGRPATQYRPVAPLMRWARAPRLKQNRRPMARVAKAMAARAAKDYALGFAAPHWAIEGAGRNHWIFRLVTRLSRQRLRRINVLLDEVARLAYTPDPLGGPLVSIACLLSPIAERARTHRLDRRVARRTPGARRPASSNRSRRAKATL